jgi:TonB family protein
MKGVLFLFMLLSFVLVKSQDEEVIEIVTSDGERKESNDIFEFVEKQPEFPGGMAVMYEFLAKELIYPSEAIESHIEGKVYVKFVVTKSGSIEGATIVRGVHKLLDKEAIRAVSAMPKWIPGEQKGKKVSVWFTLPVNFKIDGPNPKE